MKQFMITVMIILLFGTMASASIYVAYDKFTKNVYFVGDEEKNIILNDSNLEIKELDGDLETYPLEYPINYYKLTNNKLVVNTKMISDEVNQGLVVNGKMGDMDLIRNRAYKNAYEELIAEGATFDYIKPSDF